MSLGILGSHMPATSVFTKSFSSLIKEPHCTKMPCAGGGGGDPLGAVRGPGFNSRFATDLGLSLDSHFPLGGLILPRRSTEVEAAFRSVGSSLSLCFLIRPSFVSSVLISDGI